MSTQNSLRFGLYKEDPKGGLKPREIKPSYATLLSANQLKLNSTSCPRLMTSTGLKAELLKTKLMRKELESKLHLQPSEPPGGGSRNKQPGPKGSTRRNLNFTFAQEGSTRLS